jgi:hypothetical protein
MSIARFRIVGKLDRTFPQEAKVEIDRGTLLVEIRPLRRRKPYCVHLSTLCEIYVHRQSKLDAAARIAAKKTARKAAAERKRIFRAARRAK